jgi:hypothetical protein
MLLALDSHKIIFARLIRCRSFYRVLCLVRIAMGYVDYKHFQTGCGKIIFITFFFHLFRNVRRQRGMRRWHSWRRKFEHIVF